ncbi:MAG TPA: hypothetical protein ACFE0H_08185, partial [Elainellaceae cyanobacterium]
MHQQGRLRREESTRSTEEIAKYIIDDLSDSLDKVLDVLKEKVEISDSQWDTVVKEVKAKKKDFRKRIFGGITFKAARLHKVLRLETQGSSVLKLKTYLAILGHTKELKHPTSKEPLSFGSFCGGKDPSKDPSKEHLEWFSLWMNDSTFDADTEYLVKAFQEGSEIKVDGVVGLDSYMHLSRQLSQAASPYPPSRIHLTSIPSMLSAADSAALVEKLMNNAVADIQNMSPSSDSSLSQPKQAFEALIQDVEKKPLKEAIATLTQAIDDLQADGSFKQQIEAHQLNDLDHISNIFLTDSIIVEPIISMLLRLVCPLASHKTISAALDDGLIVLKILLPPVREKLDSAERGFHREHLPEPACVRETATHSQMPNIASQFRNLSNLEIRALQKMAINGLQKTNEIFSTEVGRIITTVQSNSTDDLKSVLLFYLLIKAFINRFANYRSDDSATVFNEFSKTELFEIQDQDTAFDRCDTELSLFAPPRLTIPINDNLEIAKIGKYQRRYFFLPGVVDLSFWCSPIEDQGTIKSCAALAGISLLEYFAKRSHEGYTDVSALFLYKA